MLFYDYEDCLCAYIRNRGFVCVDANSPRFDEELPPHFDLTTCDEAAPYTNPYGDVLLVHHHLPPDMCYNAVLQELCRKTGLTCSLWRTASRTRIRRCCAAR